MVQHTYIICTIVSYVSNRICNRLVQAANMIDFVTSIPHRKHIMFSHRTFHYDMCGKVVKYIGATVILTRLQSISYAITKLTDYAQDCVQVSVNVSFTRVYKFAPLYTFGEVSTATHILYSSLKLLMRIYYITMHNLTTHYTYTLG